MGMQWPQLCAKPRHFLQIRHDKFQNGLFRSLPIWFTSCHFKFQQLRALCTTKLHLWHPLNYTYQWVNSAPIFLVQSTNYFLQLKGLKNFKNLNLKVKYLLLSREKIAPNWYHELQVNLCQELFFLQSMGRTCCVQRLFWMSETISVHNMLSPGLSLEFSCIEPVIQWTICRHIVG